MTDFLIAPDPAAPRLTRAVAGVDQNGATVETRVVEEREWRGDALIEVSRNFFAFCPETSDAYYFGEEVDDYKNGEISGHGGAWLAGLDEARPGMIMPGDPQVGMKYYQEIAPNVALDRAEIALFPPASRRDEDKLGDVDVVTETADGLAGRPRHGPRRRPTQDMFKEVLAKQGSDVVVTFLHGDFHGRSSLVSSST